MCVEDYVWIYSKAISHLIIISGIIIIVIMRPLLSYEDKQKELKVGLSLFELSGKIKVTRV